MYTPTYISSAATTVVRSLAGRLGKIIVQGGSASTIIGYDNASAASGDVLFSFDSTNALAEYDFGGATFKNGLTVVTSAAVKLTIMTGPQTN